MSTLLYLVGYPLETRRPVGSFDPRSGALLDVCLPPSQVPQLWETRHADLRSPEGRTVFDTLVVEHMIE